MAKLGHFYLQKGTDTKILLPDPAPGYDVSRELVGAVQVALGGAETPQIAGRRRVWALSWNNISDTNFATIEQFVDGTKGNGPFTLYDPNLQTTDSGISVNLDIDSWSDTVNDYGFHNVKLTIRERLT